MVAVPQHLRAVWQHRFMGKFDAMGRAFGGLRSLAELELEDQREALRLEYVACQDIDKASRLFDELHRYDEEMTRRANEVYERENPNAQTRHREHGWYLSNDD